MAALLALSLSSTDVHHAQQAPHDHNVKTDGRMNGCLVRGGHRAAMEARGCGLCAVDPESVMRYA